MVFPWIEDYFGRGNLDWKIACDKEMNEVDENEDEEANVVNLDADEDGVVFVEEDGQLRPKKQVKGKGKQRGAVQSKNDSAKKGFLRLLIRCRRLILQDAAVYLYLKRENNWVNTKIPIFSSDAFKAFQEDVVIAVANPSIDRLQEFEGLVPNLVDNSREVAGQISDVNNKLVHLQREQQQSIHSIENYRQQSIQDTAVLVGMHQQLAKDMRLLIVAAAMLKLKLAVADGYSKFCSEQ
ncbi:hypothetical protein [Parasitella parasitica]|uniref:Ndc10 domain-containing protein n=1 Tax=Parasitella parasitica TaxID=35722 RepID=A0A0B7MYH5_9FUNG|nr:hypothetical protein [Parasitella parasitica]